MSDTHKRTAQEMEDQKHIDEQEFKKSKRETPVACERSNKVMVCRNIVADEPHTEEDVESEQESDEEDEDDEDEDEEDEDEEDEDEEDEDEE
jgi:hypothetical protein